MGSILNILIGLLVAAIVFLVGTALISFDHSRILFGILAVIAFLVIASGRVRSF